MDNREENIRYQCTPNDNIALPPFERQASHKTLTNYIFSESLITEDYENIFRQESPMGILTGRSDPPHPWV